MISFHCVIDSPLSVRRVMPPTATIKITMAATMKSQVANAFGRACLLILDMASVSGSAIRAVQAQIGKVFARFVQTTGKMPGPDGFP